MSLYDDLGVPRDALPVAIRLAHRKLARKYHPDKNHSPGAKENFQRIQIAYDVLSDPERREHYDKTGKTEKDDPREAARGLLAFILKQVLVAAIDSPHVDLVSAAHRQLTKLQDDVNKQAEQNKVVIGKFKKHLGRVKVKDGELNMYEAIVHAEHERAQAMLANHPEMIEKIHGARALLKEYSCEELERPAEPVSRWLW